MRSVLVPLALALVLVCAPAAVAQKGSSQNIQASGAVDPGFIGVWQNVNALTKIWIDQGQSEIHVVAIIDFDDEYFNLISQWFQGNRMQLTYYVPSTQYTVSYDCTLDGNMLQCNYQNDHGGSGPSPWQRLY